MITEIAKKGLEALEASFEKSEAQLETFGIGSQRILPGYTGKVVGLKFEQLDANSGANKVTRDQVIKLPVGEKGALVATVVAKKDVDYPVVLNIVMADERRISVNAIKQSPLSLIDGVPATGMVAKDWHALAGKTITLVDSDDDTKTTIRRPGNDGKLEARSARYMVFTTA